MRDRSANLGIGCALISNDWMQIRLTGSRWQRFTTGATGEPSPRSGGTKGAGEAGSLASVRHGLETRDNRGPRHAENDEIAGFERTPDVEHVANLGVLQWL